MKLYSYIIFAISLLALFSCNNEAEEDPNAPVGLEAYIAGVSLVTRGGATSASDIQSLGIYAVNTNTGESTYGNTPVGTYRTYQVSGGIASPNGSDQTLWLNLEKATIFSFHPAALSTTVTAGGTASVPVPAIVIPASAITLDNTSNDTGKIFDFSTAAHDYMYGVEYKDEGQATESDKYLSSQPVADNGRVASGAAGHKVSMGLKHVFAQLRLIIRKGDYAGNANVSLVTYKRKMKIVATDNTTTMNLTNGSLNNLANASEQTYKYTFTTPCTPGTSEDDAVSITNYIVPNEKAESTISLIVNNKEMSMLHKSETAWEAGNIYTYTITINGTGLELTGFNVVSWQDQSQPNITI